MDGGREGRKGGMQRKSRIEKGERESHRETEGEKKSNHTEVGDVR